MLNGLRVLDLADEKGFLCGSILAGLGADVIKIEKPGGGRERNIGPYLDGRPDPETSLYWFAYNVNKRGITLDLAAERGRELFLELAGSVQFIIESFAPGYLDRLGLGWQKLSKLNPGLILTSITPYGLSGPKRDFVTSDIVSMAEGGIAGVCGDVDRPPVRITPPQAYLLAGANAAAGTMVAHYAREASGEGQHVDVSIQESVASSLVIEMAFWEFRHEVIRRLGPFRRRGGTGVYTRTVWPCKDGHVSLLLLYGRYGERLRKLVQWMDSEGRAGHLADARDWDSFDMSRLTKEEMAAMEAVILGFLAQHTKADLKAFALREHMYMLPGNTPGEIAEDEQLAARGFWRDLEHPELGRKIRYAANTCFIDGKPWPVKRRAPMIGEHNNEVYLRDFGISEDTYRRLKEEQVI